MLEKGFVLDQKYKIVSVIGRGGTSTVYLAVHRRLGQRWAIKEIDRTYCENYGMANRQLIAEADILKRLRHPALPQIIDIIEDERSLWLVMEFVEGITLQKWIAREGAATERQVIAWGRQLGALFSYLHAQEPPIIYRDLKPENLMVEADGRLVLIDFGTAREYSHDSPMGDTTYLGTRGYAAPEQYGGMGQTDFRTDIYGIGMTLYYALTGQSPEKPPYQMAPPEVWSDKASPALQKLILKCVQTAPKERYQNCEEFLGALNRIPSHASVRTSRERGRLLICLVGAVVLAITFAFGCRQITSMNRRREAIACVEEAEKSIQKKMAEKSYRQALLLSPACEEIYESLREYFIKPNDFQMEDAAMLTNILMTECGESHVIDVLRRDNEKAYATFCYALGIGYFYDMGGFTGKKMAESWFSELLELPSQAVETGVRQRAAAYADICGYYNTFLKNGQDKSGERETKDFYDFYKTLHKLNRIAITEKSKASDFSAACLIAREVAVEISCYSEAFLAQEALTPEKLESELLTIEKKLAVIRRRDAEEAQEIALLVSDARRKLLIARERCEQ